MITQPPAYGIPTRVRISRFASNVASWAEPGYSICVGHTVERGSVYNAQRSPSPNDERQSSLESKPIPETTPCYSDVALTIL